MKALILFCLVGIAAFGAQYSVIVSKKVNISSMSVQQIKDLYLQKRHAIGNQRIIPVNLVGQEEIRTTFESLILEMDRNRLNAYWVKQHFQGVSPPLTQPSIESIKVFVDNVEGALGYIPSSMVDNRFKVVYEF